MERIALYDHARARYNTGGRSNHSAAVGFIKIFGLPVGLAARKPPDAGRKKLRVAT